ncbi:MAG TPA: hypothetical protein VF194_08500 [Ferrovibrio sp.]|uniref:hypothetical protein n=1 Tax=Ferrovibrio sp. TaxID=1917215 RepID=UPI002ED202C9
MNRFAALILMAVPAGLALPAQSLAQTQSAPQSAQAASPPQPRLDAPGGPPLGSLSLSQIIVKIEGEPNFAYVSRLDWKDGKYAIRYVTRDGETRDELIDPRTGKDTGKTPASAP